MPHDTGDMKPFLESNDAVQDTGELWRRATRDGYLFFRRLLDPQVVLDLRAQFVRILDKHGWLDPGTDADALISTQPTRFEGMPEYWPVLDDFQRLESFHALAQSEPILATIERLVADTVLVHPQNIGRIMFPSTPTTPPHQDYVHIQGTLDVWTGWIPLGDCPVDLGALAILEGSHDQGVLPVKHMPGAGGVGVDTDGIGREWRVSNLEVGDVLFFHSHAVHLGLPNRTGDRMRLSVDYRYQAVSEPVGARSLRPHFNRFDWEWFYEGWASDEYQYYWRKFDLNVVELDSGILQFVDESPTDDDWRREHNGVQDGQSSREP